MTTFEKIRAGFNRSGASTSAVDRVRLVGDHQALEMSSPNPREGAGSQPVSRGFLGLLSEKGWGLGTSLSSSFLNNLFENL